MADSSFSGKPIPSHIVVHKSFQCICIILILMVFEKLLNVWFILVVSFESCRNPAELNRSQERKKKNRAAKHVDALMNSNWM